MVIHYSIEEFEELLTKALHNNADVDKSIRFAEAISISFYDKDDKMMDPGDGHFPLTIAIEPSE